MKHGNLSNELAPTVGIRFERVIKTEEGKLNRAAKSFILYFIQTVNANLYIITTQSDRKCMSFLMKWGVPCTKVIQADSDLEIADICRENEFVTYYDVDNNVLQNVRSRGKEQTEALIFSEVEVA